MANGHPRAARRSLLISAGALVLLVAAAVVFYTHPAIFGVAPGRTDAQPSSPSSPARGANLISPEQAKERVRRFTGRPDLDLVGMLEQASFGGRSFDVYHFATLAVGGPIDEFQVDARTGEVLQAWLRSGQSAGTPLGLAEARSRAAEFAAARFAGFAELSLVEEHTTPSAPEGPLHQYRWVQVAPDSGAELPTGVSVAVSARSGQVVWYLAQREALEIDTIPLVSREQAAKAAQEQVLASEGRMPQILSIRLQVVFDEHNQQRLVWSVTLAASDQSGRPMRRVLVDARSGAVLREEGPRG